MTGLFERPENLNLLTTRSDTVGGDTDLATSKKQSTQPRSSNTSLWSNLIASTFSIFETDFLSRERKDTKRSYGWTTNVRKLLSGGSMRRLQEFILGCSKVDISTSVSSIWLLGESYKLSSEVAPDLNNGLPAFMQDFSSRIWITYRKGFQDVADTKYTSDVGWGCMIRSSQMLIAQALLLHHLGRSWRKPLHKPYQSKYIEILHHFGDSAASVFSIHNLLEAGRTYGLAAGSWIGPYAMCRAWATLAHLVRTQNYGHGSEVLPMIIYVVSGDEDGERGGAPVVFIDAISRICCDADKDKMWSMPILLLVPLVLGPDKINTRYIPSLSATFSFPQSLGIIGGKPGASTYIVGVQDDKALYLDPHEVQQVVDIKEEDLEADTSSYHCSVVRQVPLELIDPSLAIGFYCRDEDDLDDFCSRASELGNQSNGAPLFTVDRSHRTVKSSGGSSSMVRNAFEVDITNEETDAVEDEWQIL